MLEKQIEKYFADKLKELGCIVWKFTSPGTAGVPDRIVIMPYGKVVFVELKAPNKSPREIQWERIKQLINHSVDVWVISSKDHVELFINEYSKEGDL